MSRASFLLVAIVVTAARSATADQPPADRRVHVTGAASVNVVPDEVVLTVGIETVNKDIEKAQAENNQRVAAAIKIARDQGIEERQIQTDRVSLDRRYEYRQNEQVFVGFEVRQTIALTLREVSKYEALMTNLLKAGVNRVHDIEFRTTKLREYKDQARDLAMKAAREKAAALAQAVDARVVQVHTIDEEAVGSHAGYVQSWSDSSNAQVAVSAGPQSGDAGEEETLAPDQVRVTARIRVSFELQ